jgi:hypothetical protein
MLIDVALDTVSKWLTQCSHEQRALAIEIEVKNRNAERLRIGDSLPKKCSALARQRELGVNQSARAHTAPALQQRHGCPQGLA